MTCAFSGHISCDRTRVPSVQKRAPDNPVETPLRGGIYVNKTELIEHIAKQADIISQAQ